MKKTIIIIGLMLIANKAHSYNYGDTIRGNKTNIRHNLGYSKQEKLHANKLHQAKKNLDDAIGDYYSAHQRMQKYQAQVDQLEATRPNHRSYESNWDYGSTNLTYGRNR